MMTPTMKVIVLVAVCLGVVAGQAFPILNEKDTNEHTDCHSLHKAGYSINGTYRLTLEGKEYFISCEFRSGYGYTIFLNRIDSYVNWERKFVEYEYGFGFPLHDYFAGLDFLYRFTKNMRSSLEVYFMDWDGSEHYAFNEYFKVGDRSTGYMLSVDGDFRGSVENDMIYNNRQPFHTLDRPDPFGCVKQQRGGWWYNHCSKTLPTGHYYPQGRYHVNQTFADGIYWSDYKGPLWSLKRFVMAVRPKA